MISSALSALERADSVLAADYLRYHRDWLLRFFIPDADHLQKLGRQFDAQAEKINTRSLRDKFESYALSTQTPRQGNWFRSVKDFGHYVGQFDDDERYQIDPFTRNTAFPAIFKLLHSVSNQIGFHPLQEAYLYHLLLLACDDSAVELGQNAIGVAW
jgi:hypothetical protein